MNKQRAASAAALGMVLYQKGQTEAARNHKPDYLRMSQAERELKEKERDFRI
jgi:tRNA threonylcarbamoyladenosine biosynthesis protein TsaB